MAQLHVEAEGTAKASPEGVWALVSDATRYPSWGPWSDGHYEKAGEESPHGVGAVQVLRSAQRYMGRHTTSVEKILVFEEDRHLAYTVIRGIPVRNYRADVTLTPVRRGHSYPVGCDLGQHAAGPDGLEGAPHLLSGDDD